VIRGFLKRLMQQHTIGGKWLGGFKNVASGATMYITFINLVLLAVTAYATTVAPWMQGRGLNIPFVVFLGVILGIILVVFAFEYKVSVPSNFIFWNDQWWRHSNPIRRKMEMLEARLKKIEAILERIENKGG